MARPLQVRYTQGDMKVSLISTVKDAGGDIGAFLDSVRAQTRLPDEIIVVDGGSTDGTLETLRAAEDVTLIEADGMNIPRGRVIAIEAAAGDVIAVSDADCVLTPRWLEALMEQIDAGADVAMGTYRPIARNLFEICSAATHVPDIDELDPTTFMPSSRSVAFRRATYDAAGGYPEWLDVGEDMLLDLELRRIGADMRLAPDAITMWRVRPTLKATWKQYANYAKGDAQAGMWPKRHAVRFGVYGAAFLMRRTTLGKILILVGGIAYAYKPLKRAFNLTRDPLQRAAALGLVPALMAVTDLAKMTGYLRGLTRRRVRA